MAKGGRAPLNRTAILKAPPPYGGRTLTRHLDDVCQKMRMWAALAHSFQSAKDERGVVETARETFDNDLNELRRRLSNGG